MQPTVRSLEQIIAETNKTYDPLRQRLNQNRGIAAQQGEAAKQSISARRNRAFKDVEQRAANRRVFFSGAPTASQQELDALEFNPAFASLEQSILDANRRIDDSLFDLDRQQQAEAINIRAGEQKTLSDFINEQNKLARQQAQFEAKLELDRQKAAASRRSSGGGSRSSSRSSRSSGGNAGSTNYKLEQRADGGFNFTNRSGQPISAAQYAIGTGQDMIDVLDSLGAAGDSYAGQVARQLRQDPFIEQNIDAYKSQYPSLFWGI